MHASTDPVFVACWTTGPDPVRDGVWKFEARAFPGENGAVDLVPATWLQPFADPAEAAAMAPALQDAGWPVDGDGLADWTEALPALLAPLAARPVVLAGDRESFLTRFRHLQPTLETPVVLDLEGLAAFLHPGRGGHDIAELHRRFVGDPLPPGLPPDALGLRRLLEGMVRVHRARPLDLRRLFARAFQELAPHCGDDEESLREGLAMVERLLDLPSRFSADPERGRLAPPLADGGLLEDLEDSPLDPERLLRDLEPRFTAEYREGFGNAPETETLLEEAQGLPDEDHRILEAYFDALPGMFADEGAPLQPERPGQRALGHAVERTLAEAGILIADAPTGTGKTLAYLAPLLLWSTRFGVRTAVSTYTRALQEQAFLREVPRAVELLRRAGLPADREPRVSMLKGRANYLCGRAISDSAPEAGEGSAAARVAWLRLALHYCEDPFADLDAFPLHPGLPFPNGASAARAAARQVDAVRSVPGCCEGQAALRCGAGVRRLRAERAHLIVTNHAYVLAQPDDFHHLVFDESDHLHEVTVSARSFDVPLDDVSALSSRLLRGRGRDRAPLERLARLLARLAPGDAGPRLREAAAAAGEGARRLDATAFEVARELRGYQAYQREAGDKLTREEKAFLLHDWLRSGRGDKLLTALQALKEAVDLTDGGLRTVLEELGDVPYRDARKIRWSLRRPLEALAHWREGLERWLGGEEGNADFSEDFHFDAVFEGRKQPMLTLKWLLPHVWLGGTYFPSLKSAAMVSATARLRGGFKAMKGYLGLDLLAEDTLERPGREVAEFAAPPTFDSSAALVCVPQDSPPYAQFGAGLETWSQYLEDFLLFLAERTRGRILALFTNRFVLRRVAERLQAPFAGRGIPLYWQGMPGIGKEELAARFRSRVDSVLLGLDTFWYGVDFPGETCEYVVVTKLPYGVLDDYHFAQRARMGEGPHRSRVYMPRALAMFRQGCGRLLRSEHDRGAVIVLDRRALEGRHGAFLKELPGGIEDFETAEILAADSDTCLQAVFGHMYLTESIRRRGLAADFAAWRASPQTG